MQSLDCIAEILDSPTTNRLGTIELTARNLEHEVDQLIACPDFWLDLVVNLLNIEDEEAQEMARKSIAQGNPPPNLEYIVANQATAALVRGFLMVETAEASLRQ